MKQLSRISIFFFLLLAIGCSSQTATPTSLPVIATIENTETPKPRSTPTTILSPTPEQVTIEFPEWVKNPETQILLAPISKKDDIPKLNFIRMALFNAETGERFDIPFTDEVGDYFWYPDGSGFGYLPLKQKYFMLFSIDNGIVNRVKLSDAFFKFYMPNDSRSYSGAIQVTSSNIQDPNFMFLDIWDLLSPDKNYLISSQDNDQDYINIYNISNDAVIRIPKNSNEYYQLYSEWSPTSSKLAIVSVDQEFRGMYHSFQNSPTFRLRVFDMESENVVASYKNISFPNWSPDGTKFLFQEWIKQDYEYWYGGSPPCVFNTLDGKTKCFSEVLTDKNQLITSLSWSPDQSMIGYVSHDGFCYIPLLSISAQCILTSEELTKQYVLDYSWSSDGGFISFIFDIYPPFVDLTNDPKIGIANINTGQFFTISEIESEVTPGLWRPSPNP